MVSFTTVFTVLTAAATMVVGAPLEERNIAKRYSGQATYYTQGGNAGACGNVNSDSAYIVAVNSGMFDSSKCGQSVTVTNQNNGQSITATVADMCPGCGGTSLDLSTGAFQALGDMSAGVLPISWNYN